MIGHASNLVDHTGPHSLERVFGVFKDTVYAVFLDLSYQLVCRLQENGLDPRE